MMMVVVGVMDGWSVLCSASVLLYLKKNESMAGQIKSNHSALRITQA